MFVFDGLAVANFAVGAVAAVFAGAAAFFAWKAPTKQDMDRNTAHLEVVSKSIKDQQQAETLNEKMRHLAVTVSGQDRSDTPLGVRIVFNDSEVKLTHVQFVDEPGTVHGASDCTQRGEREFMAYVDPDVWGKWFQTGYSANLDSVRTFLRLFMEVQGHHLRREIPVTLSVSNPLKTGDERRECLLRVVGKV